jgi:transcriptional regulator with XRE-family HTH domain
VSPRPQPDKALAAVLRRLREDAGLSQEALAGRAGITLGAMSRVERTSPAFATVQDIASALGVSLEKLGAMIEAEGRR